MAKKLDIHALGLVLQIMMAVQDLVQKAFLGGTAGQIGCPELLFSCPLEKPKTRRYLLNWKSLRYNNPTKPI